MTSWALSQGVVGEIQELAELNDRERLEIREEAAAEEGTSSGAEGAEAEARRLPSMLQSCRSVDEFERIYRISEGTYGIVYRCAEQGSQF